MICTVGKNWDIDIRAIEPKYSIFSAAQFGIDTKMLESSFEAPHSIKSVNLTQNVWISQTMLRIWKLSIFRMRPRKNSPFCLRIYRQVLPFWWCSSCVLKKKNGRNSTINIAYTRQKEENVERNSHYSNVLFVLRSCEQFSSFSLCCCDFFFLNSSWLVYKFCTESWISTWKLWKWTLFFSAQCKIWQLNKKTSASHWLR